ncbi:TetR family transcriptional regulator [Corynebacterium sp. 3HC-13]|uniref:TetR/AcrR family transcriptional regulator n=1 Tax=Corynebacterium poyangense TaxID=2684405 RepID=UPI001CCFCB41|nr:TetR/AcrR family transcriptional regulator [Corynebacterium poyangense]MBZ8176255.1 TetR family transcriptional regulator [Corynebacterium poyangense]
MPGLREARKAKTRSALALAAAEIALEHGTSALTIAAITSGAGVSTRTFHNYFSSREEALLEFIVEQVRVLAREVQHLPANLGLLEISEKLTIITLDADGPARLPHLFRLSEMLREKEPGRSYGGSDTDIILAPIIEALTPRAATLGFQKDELVLAVHLVARSIAFALQRYEALPDPRDPEVGEYMIHNALGVIRRL